MKIGVVGLGGLGHMVLSTAQGSELNLKQPLLHWRAHELRIGRMERHIDQVLGLAASIKDHGGLLLRNS